MGDHKINDFLPLLILNRRTLWI